jgi:RNA polymerase sigma factor (sigma-70 family)
MKATASLGVAQGTVVPSARRASGALSDSMNGWLQHRMKDWPRVWSACTSRTHAWRVPPRWSLSDWFEEIDAESIAAACHAIRIFDPHRGPTLSTFVYHQILASALGRYRQEWTYALRYGVAAMEEPGVTGAEERFTVEQEEEQLKQSLTSLPEADRHLLEHLFWEGRTETEIADGLGISQQAVSKRKRKILTALRRSLKHPEESLKVKKRRNKL